MSAPLKLDILSSELRGNELRVSLGDRSLEEGAIGDATLWGIDGFYSRPLDPDDRGACMGLFLFEGNNRRVFATKDNRITAKYGDISPGDRAIVTDGDARIIVKLEGDSVSIVTKNHADNDELMIQQLSGDSGEFVVMIGGTKGTAMLKIKSGAIALVAGGSSLMVDEDGVTINGKRLNANVGGGNLGTVGPMTPQMVVNSLLYGPMGQTGVAAPNWVVSPA
jgi:hypothetical protein